MFAISQSPPSLVGSYSKVIASIQQECKNLIARLEAQRQNSTYQASQTLSGLESLENWISPLMGNTLWGRHIKQKRHLLANQHTLHHAQTRALTNLIKDYHTLNMLAEIHSALQPQDDSAFSEDFLLALHDQRLALTARCHQLNTACDSPAVMVG